jgi:pimeloyl-ACP methyl ester carboxylesterase
LLLTTASCASAPHDVQFATINGHRVAYRVLGAGSPAVVMISGLGEGMATFDDVAADLANTTTVIVYDRAGYGDSEPVDGARDARAAADELAALLPQTRIEGPYILLGHSLGGLYAEYYAAEYPDQVSGLILEDSRPADFTRRCEAARISICAPPTALGAFMPKGAQAEMRALPNISAEVERATPMSGKPVLVLSRPLAAKAKGFDALWSTNQASLAARYSGAQHLTAPGGGHGIHRDQKEWFVKATTSFVEANRPPT